MTIIRVDNRRGEFDKKAPKAKRGPLSAVVGSQQKRRRVPQALLLVQEDIPQADTNAIRGLLNTACKYCLRKIFNDQVVQEVKTLKVIIVDTENSILADGLGVSLEAIELEEAMREDSRKKARLVVKGYLQHASIDFKEMFAGVGRYFTLRTLLAKAAVEDLEIDNIDIDTAFLNEKLTDGIKVFLKLKKLLYGLKPERTIKIHNSNYTKRILQRFHIDESMAKDLPLPFGTTLYTAEATILLGEDDKNLYLQIVGSVIYLANCSRSDISFAVEQLVRVIQSSEKQYLIYTKHLLQYLIGIANTGLVYSGRLRQLPSEYNAFIDSTWGSEQRIKSTQGVVIIRYGGAVVWSSTKQKSTSQSTMEAEIIAVNEGAKDLAWMEKLVYDLGERSREEPFIPILYCDNRSGVDWIKENKFHSKAKHINIRWHYIRDDIVDANRIRALWIAGTDQAADILTKQLIYPGFCVHCIGLGFDIDTE
ncbi:polyprotein [Sclerotinia borealis F-4128]|uniref:Polyprotein n=1 Tax=Sclerotinia borealis (strain F-4128) TaxID=1432307 RepID=W9C7E8_SCLBF|nr:polyprotein [Sclerotinia borealis F-4128]